ncbi:MAG TPA: YidC/Oxa1 family membrane protein insertase [Patescibacteria group bacterium]|nr:YidC/Oxa1 family membrane protein insertase [Patescibacteria group bacterium]
MNPISLFFTDLIVNPIVTIVAGIYHGLNLLHIPSPLGFTIIILTVVIRFILAPITASQLKTAKKMQMITPHLNKLKDKHKNDSKQLQAATMALYKEHGVNPAAGCLPLLIQLPVIWGLYYVLQQIVNNNPKHVVDFVNHAVYISAFKITTAWDIHFFGLPLGQTPSKLFSTLGIGVLLVPVLTAAFQFVQSKMMAPVSVPGQKEEKKEADFATAFQTQSLFILPLMIGFFSWTLPVGLSFYWNTFTIFGIIQQYMIQGWGGLEEWIEKISPNTK